MYKRRKIVGRNNFSGQEDNYSVQRNWIQVEYHACLVVKPITVNKFDSLFNYTLAGRSSELSKTAT